jgi:hypothetical protein
MSANQQRCPQAVGEFTEAAALLVSLALLAQSGCTPEGAGSVELGDRGDVVKGITNPTLPPTPSQRPPAKERPVPKGLRLPGSEPSSGERR